MKATQNIKIGGRWYHPGEDLPEEKPVKAVRKPAEAKEPEKAPETEAAEANEKPAQEKTTSRRRKSSK